MRKSKILAIRLSLKMFDDLKKVATKEGLTVADCSRKILLRNISLYKLYYENKKMINDMTLEQIEIIKKQLNNITKDDNNYVKVKLKLKNEIDKLKEFREENKIYFDLFEYLG